MISMTVTGIKEAQKHLKQSADMLAGTKGQFYQHQTKIIKGAIERNADSSYENSPAKETALKSAEQWQHIGREHINNIESTLYANYRQYGCGGLTITVLVDLTEADQQALLDSAVSDLSRL